MRKGFFVFLLGLLFIIASCGGGGGGGGSQPQPPQGNVLVITSDYSTGSYSILDTENMSSTNNINIIHSDSMGRYFNGKIYIIERLEGDAIIVLDQNDPTTIVTQYSVGNGTNPQDINVIDQNKAYITLYGTNYLLIVNPSTGAELGRIDFSPLADADGIPEMCEMVRYGDYIFVAVQRLDRNNWFAPTDKSYVAVIDTKSDSIVNVIELTGLNPIFMQYNEFTQKILVGEAGSFFDLTDGGIETIDPRTFSAEGFVITESTLGGQISGAFYGIAMADANMGYIIIMDESWNTALVSFDLSTGNKLADIDAPSNGFIHNDIIRVGDKLLLAYREETNPGVRIFNINTATEITPNPINTGLPPITFVIY
ncbi:MAG: hypothetical protein JRI44_05825 [Deltaproteobacteria bacterium]|nr:hypothetical protein [Deltaproteobacteria bacterium]